jgi:hypothetical protein
MAFFSALSVAGICQLLKPDGVFSMVDIKCSSHLQGNMGMGAVLFSTRFLSRKLVASGLTVRWGMVAVYAPFLYTISLLHCLPVGKYEGGAGLGAMWGKEGAQAMLAEAGFGSVQLVSPPEDHFNVEYRCRRS